MQKESETNTYPVCIDYLERTQTGVEAEILNLTKSDIEASAYLGVYDIETNRLIDIRKEVVTVYSNDMYTFQAQIDLSANALVKMFVFEDDSLQPLALSIELE